MQRLCADGIHEGALRKYYTPTTQRPTKEKHAEAWKALYAFTISPKLDAFSRKPKAPKLGRLLQVADGFLGVHEMVPCLAVRCLFKCD